jgi:hypothetical protein
MAECLEEITCPVERAVELAHHRLALCIAEAHLAALEALLPHATNEHFHLKLEVDQQEHWLDCLVERYDDEDYRQAKAVRENSLSWLEHCKAAYGWGEPNPVKLATDAVRRYKAAEHQHEFGYVDTINPEGQSEQVLLDELNDAEQEMMAALSDLSDAQIEQVLAANKRRDHDGSLFSVTSVEEVRRWQAQFATMTIAQWRQAELAPPEPQTATVAFACPFGDD